MNNNKYHGWLRLGLIISFMWLLGATGIISLLHNRETNDFNSTAWGTRNNGEWAVVGKESFLSACKAKSTSQPIETLQDFQRLAEPECNVRLDHAAIILIAPMGIAWLLIPVAVWTFLWVRKGFNK